jgi:hypothetical protein
LLILFKEDIFDQLSDRVLLVREDVFIYPLREHHIPAGPVRYQVGIDVMLEKQRIVRMPEPMKSEGQPQLGKFMADVLRVERPSIFPGAYVIVAMQPRRVALIPGQVFMLQGGQD